MEKKTYSNLVVSSAPHIVTNLDTSRTMAMVILALVPSLLVSIWVFGFRALILTVVCIAASMFFEWVYNKLMKKTQTVGDLSAALTGMLIAFNVPSGLPYWIAIVGCFVAIIVVKQLFGGIGKNIVNPAITARIVLFISFATEMTTWPVPNPLHADAATGATPLGILAEGGGELPSNMMMFLGVIGGSMGEVSAIALLIGGLFLIWKKIISPIIPACFIGTVFVFAFIYYAATGDGSALNMAIFHVLAGGVMLGAFFMATDYVTTPLLPLGKVIFGVGCGLLTMIIRLWGQYPEGVSFSILIMNCLTPLIEDFCQKRMYGGAKMKSNTYKEYIAPVVVLVAICLVVTFALAFVNSVTAPIIEENAIATANAARAELLPAADTFTAYEGEMVEMDPGKVFVEEVYTADNGSGVVVTVKTKSFGGLLTEMVGIDANGAVTGVKVTAHGDTPGLGTKAHDPAYLEQYKGMTEYADTTAKGDPNVTHVSGATISSNAVHYGVCAALEQFKAMGGAN